MSPNTEPPALPVWLKAAAAALSGILWFLSWPNGFFPGFSPWPGWLAWIAFIPYIYVWHRTSWKEIFVYGWATGFFTFLGILSWLTLINRDTNVSNVFAWIFFSVVGGFKLSLVGAAARIVKDRLKLSAAVVLPLSWVTWEYLRGHFVCGGWPWGELGHTQYANPIVRQFAAVAGVSGISFLIILVNVALLALGEWGLPRLLGRLPGFPRAPQAKKSAKPRQENSLAFILNLTLILAGLALGGMGLLEIGRCRQMPERELRVGLIQGNINTDQEWDDNYKTAALARMQDLHLQAAAGKPDLIVWSESCFPSILDYKPEKIWNDKLRVLIKAGGVPTVITSNEYIDEVTGPQEEPRYHHYNSSFFLGADGRVLGRYRKIRLVPFGEYIPYAFLKSFMHAVVREPIPVDFEPGQAYVGMALGPLKFSPLICYEDQFEELGVSLARQGARMFVGLANDRWAAYSAMAYQHTAMSVFLAVEHRAPMVKANMTGPTCVIDAWGNISKPLPFFAPGVLFENVKYYPGF